MTVTIDSGSLQMLARKQVELDQAIDVRDRAIEERDRTQSSFWRADEEATEAASRVNGDIYQLLLLDRPIDYQKIGQGFADADAAEVKSAEIKQTLRALEQRVWPLADDCQRLSDEIERGIRNICAASRDRMEQADQTAESAKDDDSEAQSRVDDARTEVRLLLRQAWASGRFDDLDDESTQPAVDQARETARSAAAKKAETHRALRKANETAQQARAAYSRDEETVREQIRRAAAELAGQVELASA